MEKYITTSEFNKDIIKDSKLLDCTIDKSKINLAYIVDSTLQNSVLKDCVVIGTRESRIDLALKQVAYGALSKGAMRKLARKTLEEEG